MYPKQLVILLLSIAFVLSFVQASNFANVVEQLPRLQDPTGGFRQTVKSPAASLEATSDALFISALYGLSNKVNVPQVLDYLSTLKAENGYSSTAGGSASLSATYAAVSSFAYLGEPVLNADKVTQFVLSLKDSNNLFANSNGGRGNVKSTFHALSILKAVNGLSALSEADKKAILDTVQAGLVDGHFEFPGVPATKGNFYGIFITDALSTISDPDSFLPFILSQQSSNGGFFVDAERTTVDFESTGLALASLDVLENYSQIDYSARVRVADLVSFVNSVPLDIVEAASAHKAIAHTPSFADNFKFFVEYGPNIRSNKIIQGTVLKPEVTVRAFGGPSHPNFDVVFFYQFEGGEVESFPLSWDQDRQRYVSQDSIETADIFGQVQFQFNLALEIFGNGKILLDQSDEKLVGFQISAVPTATNQLTGATIKEGESISVGTDFEFDVKLSNKFNSNIKSGNFKVSLSGIDSSNIIFHQETVDAVENDKFFHFAYSFNQANIPSGIITFVVSVAGENNQPHSYEHIAYTFDVPLVASDITFDNEDREYKLGDKVTISFVPATSPNLREAFPLRTTDKDGLDVSSKRKFFLDISTKSGLVLQSLSGVPDGNGYSFEYVIPATYESLGSTVVSFRYQTVQGTVITLENYDSSNNELFESELSLNVDAKLVVEVYEKPTNTKFNYGNNLTFKFKVTDEVSGSSVGVSPRGGVFMTLSHEDSSKGKFVSTRQVAEQDGDNLLINWEVNPNAIGGKGVLSLVAEGADGSEIPLNFNGKAFSLNVEIGGDIKFESTEFSTSNYFTTQTAFVVEFTLSCDGNPLSNVKLRASVTLDGKEITSVPVGTAGNKYVASWNANHSEYPSGNYVVEFYREADQARAAENQESRQKLAREKKREAELAGTPFDEQAFLNSISTEKVTPLFTVNVPHKQVSRGGFPFGTEWALVFPLVGAFLYIDNIKRKYNTRN